MVHAYVWAQEQKANAMRGKGKPLTGMGRDSAAAALKARLEAKHG